MQPSSKDTKPTRSQSEYIRRINMALAYIETKLDSSITLADVAQASHFSAYHFHRIFHGLMGETVNDYIHRKRMEQAAGRIAFKPYLSITTIAEQGGFSSSANFAKAFKLYFGVSPTELRKPQKDKVSKIGKLYSKYGKAFRPEDLYSQLVTNSDVFDYDKLEKIIMDITVQEIPERKIAYLSSPGGYNLQSVYDTWDKILSWAGIKDWTSETDRRFAICHDNPSFTPEDKCRYDAAVVIDDQTQIPAAYSQSMVPAGKYAVVYFKDDASKINSVMTEVCSRWFANSSYEPDNYPPIFNYLNDSRVDGFVEMNVYIKVKDLEIGG